MALEKQSLKENRGGRLQCRTGGASQFSMLGKKGLSQKARVPCDSRAEDSGSLTDYASCCGRNEGMTIGATILWKRARTMGAACAIHDD
jgi:hypothetical protein